MKYVRLHVTTLLMMITILSLPVIAQGASFTSGAQCTITMQAVNSDGTLKSLSVSTIAVADANGKVSFTISNGIPTSDTYNFLVVTVTDGTSTRKAVVPAPAVGGTVDLGVSETSTVQANALISAFETIGSDNPLMAAMIALACRSAALNQYEAKYLAMGMRQCVLGPQSWLITYAASGDMDDGVVDINGRGLVPYLVSKGYSDYLTSFYSQIQSRFYLITALMKESVDNYFANAKDTGEEAKKRGEAAGKVIDVLVEAADAAGIDTEHFLNAFPEMGIVMVCVSDYMADNIFDLVDSGGDDLATANTWLSEHLGMTLTDGDDFNAKFPILDRVALSIESSFRQGVMKAKAKAMTQKYEDGLVTLNATDNQVTRYTTATSALTTSMMECFETFEAIFADCDPDDSNSMPSQAEMQALQNDVFGPGGTMDTAFNTYMTNAASTEAEIDGTEADGTLVDDATNDGLRWKVANALGLDYYKWADRFGDQSNPDRTYLGDDVGKFWGMSGESWIPITMAVVINWAADVINNGGYISYYGTGADPDQADLSADYSSLYQQGERTGDANAPAIPNTMSWLKQLDFFYVSEKPGGDTVKDPIKSYDNDEFAGKSFGKETCDQNGCSYTKWAEISSNTGDTLTLNFTGTGKAINDILANQGMDSSFFIYVDNPQRKNFASECSVKNKAHLTMANIKAIRQDIEIIEFAMFAAMGGGPVTDQQFQAANELKKTRLDNLVSKIGGMQNSDGLAITTAQKEALVLMFVQPDF